MSEAAPSGLWVTAAGWALVHFLWQGAVLHGLLMIVLQAVPRRFADARYALALGTLTLMVLAPFVTTSYLARPALHGRALPETGDAQAVTAPLPSVGSAQEHYVAVRREALESAPVAVLTEVTVLRGRAAAVMPRLVQLWLLGVALFGVRLAGGLVSVARIRRQANAAVPDWLSLTVGRVASRMGVGTATVKASARAVAPMVVGYLRPVIVLPTSVLCGMQPAQLELILAHELAHIKRWDPLVNAMQSVIETLLFYHPSVWRVSEVVRVEREYRSDGYAMAFYPDRLDYAQALSDLATIVADRSPSGVAATGGSLLVRVRRVLGRADRAHPVPGALAAAAVALLVGSLGTAFAVSDAHDPVTRLLANPAGASRLSEAEVASLTRSALRLQEPVLAAVLEAIAPAAAASSELRTYYLYAASTLSQPLRDSAIRHLHVVDDAKAADPPPTETLSVGPNDAPNYRSVGFLRAPLLEAGFDLGRAGLANREGDRFRSGRQFVYVRTLVPPGDGLDRTRLLEQLDMSRLRRLSFSDPGRVNVLLVKTPNVESAVPQFNNPDYTIEELWRQPDVSRLEGPWTVWVDAANIVTNVTTIAQYDLPDGTMISIPAPPQYACVEDGRVVGSFGGYWAAWSDGFVMDLFEDCISGAWGDAWSSVAYPPGQTPVPLELVDGSGRVLTQEDLVGHPYVLVAPAPLEETPQEVPVGGYIVSAIQPDPAVRIAQVEELLVASGVDARIVVLALPYVHDGFAWDGAAVADALTERLDVPVFEDATGAFMKSFAHFVSRQNPLLLFDSSGRLVDAYVDLPTGEVAFPGFDMAPDLNGALRRLAGTR